MNKKTVPNSEILKQKTNYFYMKETNESGRVANTQTNKTHRQTSKPSNQTKW